RTATRSLCPLPFVGTGPEMFRDDAASILRVHERFGGENASLSHILAPFMNILGINAFHGDASAVLVKDGVLVAAIEEERLNRRKHCAGFPTMAVRAVLASGGVAPADLDHVAISRDPKANLHKKILFAVQK